TDGAAGSDATFPDMNTFFFRKAEAYLTYAEALTRAAGGTAPAAAIEAVNVLRNRAHASEFKAMSLQDILDEWGREFYFEGRRRVDLIRFGKFGGNTDYIWQWKGGEYAGRNFDAYRNIFAIPTTDIVANKNLTQNEGYK
ncbi:MAG: RagB/SusD family nutrient uptake outer membrane protein, partial [Muribaculaceae bacterium]|nr:RagB/SusD family nutrient uptake outer membrane protein [Muribaculaceae bacterium]